MTAQARTTLVAYDGSPTSKAAITYAARRLQPDGRLVVAHVVAPPGEYLDELYDERRHHARERGEALVREVKATLGEVPAELRVGEGPPAHTLVELAREAGADEIVIGSRGFGAGRAALGSVSHGLLHETDRPVVVLTRRAAEREAGRDAAEHALDAHAQVVGYDGSASARAALKYALARGHDVEFDLPRRGCDCGRLARAWTGPRRARQRLRGAAARGRYPRGGRAQL